MVKQPNGKYFDGNSYSNGGRFNLTADEYIEMKVDEARKRASLEIVTTELKNDMSPWVKIFNNLIKSTGYEKAKEQLIAVGFNEDQLVKEFVVHGTSDGFSNHDCCSYGSCPICGYSIDSYKRHCPNCGQRVTLD